MLWATIIASDARFGHHFSPRLLRDLFHPLSGAFGIAFTRLDRRMAEPLLDRDDLRPFFQEVRRKRMPSTMTAGLDVRGLAIAFQLFLHALGGEGPLRALLIPEQHLVRDMATNPAQLARL